jgi:3-hydroxybutyryl-CoA dehydrogenase
LTVATVAVIGSGLMGRGIAYAAAVGGYRTILHDVSAQALAKALEQIRQDLDAGRSRGKLTEEQVSGALGRLTSSPDLDRTATSADFVIEAIPEDMGLKVPLFGRLDALCAPPVVLASNTSSLSITELAAATHHPERVLGMHFFNPVPKMKLVEIVRALDTSQAAIEATREVAEHMGKETVLVRESPGFITSRVNAMIGNEAFHLLHEGVATPEDIDRALKLGLNHPMGPFEMVDLVGLDTRLSVLQYLHQTLGERYRPSPLLVQLVKAGRLGRKAGRGVYDYREKQ